MPPIKSVWINPYMVEIFWVSGISNQILREILIYKSYLKETLNSKIEGERVGYHSICIKFLETISPQDLEEIILNSTEVIEKKSLSYTKTWKVPVCYHPTLGKDLATLSNHHNISTEEIVKIHTEGIYTLHFYGFLPGFMYLGGLNERLHTPRKISPELKIKAGSVALGGTQTGIYPQESPGGWYIIGNSPLKFFESKNDSMVTPLPGDNIKFIPIELERHQKIMKLVENKLYVWEYE
jgi:inhibitor of KinA